MSKPKLGSHSRPRLTSLEVERNPKMDVHPKYQGPKLLSPRNVVVYGSRLCVCCTKLRRSLEMEGWRFRWVEMSKRGMVQLKHMFPAWKGGLPVIVIDGLWLEVPSNTDGSLGWAPWPIRNPKKRTFIPIEA
jgi:hypothetical protein